jgi:hypothetical protein
VAEFGFEPGEVWTLGGTPGYASIQSAVFRSGAAALRLRLLGGAPPLEGSAESAILAVSDPGIARPLVLWVNATRRTDAKERLAIEHYPNGTAMVRATVAVVASNTLAAGWNRLEYSVTPSGEDDRIYLASDWLTGVPAPLNEMSFYVDDVQYGVGMAVKLAERGVGAIIGLLQAQLETELAAIDAERADGITLAVPPDEAYYARPKPEIAGGAVHIEVYESEFDFLDPYTDADAGRAVFDLPVTVRVTWFNRDGDDRDTMVTRGRRYATAVFNVLNKNYSLADADDATVIISAQRVTPAWSELEEKEPGVMKGRITIATSTRCEEVQA